MPQPPSPRSMRRSLGDSRDLRIAGQIPFWQLSSPRPSEVIPHHDYSSFLGVGRSLRLRQARIPAGEFRWVWDGRDDSGAAVPPGVYILEAGSGVREKVVKLK